MVYQKPFSTQEGVGVFSSRGINGKYHEKSNPGSMELYSESIMSLLFLYL